MITEQASCPRAQQEKGKSFMRACPRPASHVTLARGVGGGSPQGRGAAPAAGGGSGTSPKLTSSQAKLRPWLPGATALGPAVHPNNSITYIILPDSIYFSSRHPFRLIWAEGMGQGKRQHPRVQRQRTYGGFAQKGGRE